MPRPGLQAGGRQLLSREGQSCFARGCGRRAARAQSSPTCMSFGAGMGTSACSLSTSGPPNSNTRTALIAPLAAAAAIGTPGNKRKRNNDASTSYFILHRQRKETKPPLLKQKTELSPAPVHTHTKKKKPHPKTNQDSPDSEHLTMLMRYGQRRCGNGVRGATKRTLSAVTHRRAVTKPRDAPLPLTLKATVRKPAEALRGQPRTSRPAAGGGISAGRNSAARRALRARRGLSLSGARRSGAAAAVGAGLGATPWRRSGAGRRSARRARTAAGGARWTSARRA